jgi:hypothetical protein
MRHPILRILAAIIIGLWSPMCCCQAADLLGSPCVPAPESCCSGCHDSDQPEPAAPCDDCHGTFMQAGIVPAPDHIPQPTALTPVFFDTALFLSIPDAIAARHPAATPPPPAGRDLLRRHCALIV